MDAVVDPAVSTGAPLPKVAIERWRLLGRDARLRVARNMASAAEYYEHLIAALERENAELRARLAMRPVEKTMPDDVPDTARRNAGRQKHAPGASEVVLAVAAAFGLAADDLRSALKRGKVVTARHVAAWLIYHCCADASLTWTGEQLGGRDHTTILAAIRMVDERYELRCAALRIARKHGWELLRGGKK